jgi:predicted RNase H-like HicB family nuclease
MKAKVYKVVLERDEDGFWVAPVPGVRGCHTQGKTIGRTMERIREALSLFVDDAETAELRSEVRLPREYRQLVARMRGARAKAEREQARARDVAQQVARRLTADFGLSVREAAAALGLSHQRIQQLR